MDVLPIAALIAGLGAATVLLDGGRLGLMIRAASPSVQVMRDLRYVPGSRHPRHRLDVYLPRGLSGYPVVHFVHGGYWRSGGRRHFAAVTGLYGNVGIALARRGIGVVVQSYRLCPEVSIEPMMEDIARGVAWTLEHVPRVSGGPTPLVLAGHSAGAHLVSLLTCDRRYLDAAGVDPARIRGVISLGGIFDVELLAIDQVKRNRERVTWRLFGKDVDAQRRYSPVHCLRPDLPPFQVFVADRDYDHIVKRTAGIVDRMREAGVAVELITLEGYSHEGMVLRMGGRTDRHTDAMVRFIESVTR